MTSVLRKIELPIPTATYDLIKRFSDRNPNIEGKLGRATTQGANGNFIVDGTELLECLLCSRYNDEEKKEYNALLDEVCDIKYEVEYPN